MPQSPIPNPPSLIPPGSTIGILGGGQLGRMLAIAAAEMGYHAHIYCPEENAPASEVALHTTVAAYDDHEALARFARSVDVVTYEFENIPHIPVAGLAKIIPVFPSPDILATSQHRIKEKTALRNMGISTAPFALVTSNETFETAVRQIGIPAVMKTCTMGYDGKGQWKITKPNLEDQDWELANKTPYDSASDRECILEGWVPFRMEISVIVARDLQGNVACYCPVQNIHKHHILSETIAPAPISDALAQKAEAIARTIADGLKLVGLMAVEMFVTASDEILVNELAPRPHNSGHWTIDACVTSQFEQTICAICGLPLGSTQRLSNARMLNLIGDDINDWARYAAMPNAKLHLYGKEEARPGRKMGHVTLLDIND